MSDRWSRTELWKSRSSFEQHFPLLAEMERDLANVRIRNVGTLAGNLCFAEPHADPGALLAAYDAVVTLRNSEGERRVAIKDFFTDYYETALQKRRTAHRYRDP